MHSELRSHSVLPRYIQKTRRTGELRSSASPDHGSESFNLRLHKGNFYDFTYDLKGCADDKFLLKDGEPVPAVHKRIWHLHMWYC